jgi:hypothetical protein
MSAKDRDIFPRMKRIPLAEENKTLLATVFLSILAAHC